MHLAIIGTGNVGFTLATAFQKAGHHVVLGVRDPEASFSNKEGAEAAGLLALAIPEAVAASVVVVLCAPGQLAAEVAAGLGDLSGKVVIDTMNAVFQKPGEYANTSEAILANSNAEHLAKCFNTTGYENMADPNYGGEGIDLFVAGTTDRAKTVAVSLAKDIGFGAVHDFGGRAQFGLLEQFALCWINLAILQGGGRNMAFRVVRR